MTEEENQLDGGGAATPGPGSAGQSSSRKSSSWGRLCRWSRNGAFPARVRPFPSEPARRLRPSGRTHRRDERGAGATV